MSLRNAVLLNIQGRKGLKEEFCFIQDRINNLFLVENQMRKVYFQFCQ